MEHLIIPALAAGIMLVVAYSYRRAIRAERAVAHKRIDEIQSRLGDKPLNALTRASAARSTDQVVSSLWQDWQDSLVVPPGQDIEFRTINAEEIFTPERLMPGIARFRSILAAPSIFTGLGVLFTFIGLAAGFLGLDLSSEGASADNIVESAGRLVSAAGFAFGASIFGVGLSLAFNIAEKRVERTALLKLAALQKSLDDSHPLHTPERALLQISAFQQQSVEALQELHEKIGARLQEAVEQQSTTIREALSASITEAMLPSMDKLVSATTEQSSQVFEGLVERFAASFTDLGVQQRAAMDASSDRLQATIDGLGAQVAAVTEEMRRQSGELAAQQEILLASLDQLSSSLMTSTADLDRTAASLTAISERFEKAGAVLTSDLESATTTLERVFDKLEEQARAHEELTTHTTSLASQMTSGSERMLQATTTMGGQLDRFSEVQSTFAHELETNSTALADALRNQVERLTSQVADWLGQYSADVERQIETRMEKWNSVSQDYASSMLTIAQALNDAIDELPVPTAPAETAA